jgi:glutathione reductase (NADPH)
MELAAAGYGYSVDQKFDWSVLKAKKDAEILRLNGLYQGMCDRAGVTVYRSRAKVIDPHTISIEGKDGKEQRITSERYDHDTGCKHTSHRARCA